MQADRERDEENLAVAVAAAPTELAASLLALAVDFGEGAGGDV